MALAGVFDHVDQEGMVAAVAVDEVERPKPRPTSVSATARKKSSKARPPQFSVPAKDGR